MAEFLALVARARQRAGDEQWPEAAALWTEVVTANPVNGDYWQQLADARFANRDYAPARDAYQRVIELGRRDPDESRSDAAYRIACCHAALGDRDEAVRALDRALTAGYRYIKEASAEEYWLPLLDDPRVRDLFGIIDADAMSRDDGWRYDLAFLTRQIGRLAYAPDVMKIEEEAAVLRGRIPALTDAEIVAGMMRLVRCLDDGHAAVRWPGPGQRLVPADFYCFPEGLHVVAAGPGHERLLGARVENAGPMLAALDAVIPRDNEQEVKLIAPIRLRDTALLHALHLTGDPDTLTLTVRYLDGTTGEVTLHAEPAPHPFDPYPADWTRLADTTPDPVPLYLRNPGLPFWFDYLPEASLVYFQYNAVMDHPAETFATFCDRMFGFIETSRVTRLVIDLRWNGGGNTYLSQALLHHLIRSRQLGLFVIIGRHTFSAAQNTATAIDRELRPVFVGEPTGSRPNFTGETIPFELPYSGVRANVSDLYWQTSWPGDSRTWIAPDIYTPPTFEAYQRNQDPAMDAILALRGYPPG